MNRQLFKPDWFGILVAAAAPILAAYLVRAVLS